MSELPPVETNPEIPKTMRGTIEATIKAASALSDNLHNYVMTGDIEYLRHATSSMLVLRSMGTKKHLNDLLIAGIRGVHPLSDEDRQSLIPEKMKATPA
jgi:hypothetical protein